MRENFNAVIGARINEFRKKMADVDRIVKKTAMETVKPIGAKINEFRRKMAEAQAIAKKTLMRDDKTIGADISEFMRKAALVAVATRSLNRKVVVDIGARVGNFTRVLSNVANTIRSFDTVILNTLSGLLTTVSPTLVPIIASLVGFLGQLGPMLGTIAGSTFALASALGFAGFAAAGFGAVAIPTISALFDETAALTAQQQAARNEFDKFTSTYKEIVKALEQPVLDAFSKAMQFSTRVLQMARPMFDGAAVAVNNLMSSLNASLDSAPIQAFFDYMNKNAGPLLETTFKGIGFMLQGLFNMMTAFGPLAEATAQGFLDMNKRFADWAHGLSSSKSFQSFVSYVNENMPKVRAIFRDGIAGMIYMFAAFGASSSDMMTGFANMMARYKEWGRTLGDNEGFQKFVTYFMTNGPKVLDLIGNLTKFIVQMGIGLAPLGSALLDIVNKFLVWSTEMMRAHPIIGTISGALIVMLGAFIALVPNIVALMTLFSGLGPLLKKGLGAAITSVTPLLTRITGVFAGLSPIIQSLVKRIPLVGSGLAGLAGPVGIAIGVLVLLIPVFKRLWNENEAFRNSVTQAWNSIKNTISNVISAISAFVISVWGKLVKWWEENHQKIQKTAQRVWDTIYRAISTIILTIWDVIQKIVTRIQEFWAAHGENIKAATKKTWEAIKRDITLVTGVIWSVIKGALGLIQGLFQTVWPIISGIVKVAWAVITSAVQVGIDLVFGVINTTMSLLKGDWRGAWNSILQTANNIWKSIVSVFKNIDLRSIGRDIIQGLINGIKSMASAVKDTVTGIANNIKNTITSAMKIKSPSRVMISIGEFIGQGLFLGLASKIKDVSKVSKTMADATIPDLSDKIATNTKMLKQYNDVVYKLGRKSASERLDEIRKFVSDKKSLEQVSVKDEVAMWQKAVRSFKDGTDEKRAAQLALRDAKKALDQEMLNNEMEYIDKKKKLGEISLANEVRMLDTLSEKYASNSAEYDNIMQRRATVLEEINTKLTSLNEEYLNKTKSLNDELIAEEKRLTDAYEQSVEDRTKSLYSFTGLFSEISSSFKGSGQDLINNLKGQVNSFRDWSEDIAELARKGIDGGLLEELRLLGPQAFSEIAALNSLSSQQLEEYQSLWREKSSLARQQAVSELEGMRLDTQDKIKQLHARTKLQLEELRKEWVSKIELVTKGTREELATLESIGEEAIQGLINGMASMEGALIKQANRMASSVKNAMKSALDIHSPSRVLRTIGQYAGQGLVVGLGDTVKSVMKVAKELAIAATPQNIDLSMNNLDVGLQMDELKDQIKQELKVDLWVHQKGSAATGGFKQEVHLHSPRELSPAENAKQLRKTGERQALEWGFS